ncbi:MAG: hypothetical protein JW880_04985 [Candidatus Thermoplasmatota archaeon]|nr:hypothetical protein [Candidatus Thermoplasmatota archaeon]
MKRDKKGREYFSCNDIGGGTNIFPRTPLGRERLEEWKKAASVSIPEPAEEATAPSAPSGKDGDEAAPSADPFKIALSKFLERGRQDPS